MRLRQFSLSVAILLAVSSMAFTQEIKQPAEEELSLEAKLDQKLDVKFTRTPLIEAIAELSKQSKITITLDGDALKFEGLTQNIPLTMTLKNVTVREALQSIREGKGSQILASNSKKLVFTCEEKTQALLLSTRAQAARKKIRIYELKAKELTLEEKLQQKIDINFRKTAMLDAFAYISGQSGIPITLDGEALKSVGFTMNMNQEMNLGTVTVQEAILGIVKGKGHRIIQDNPDTMVLILNRQGDGFIVSTVPYATVRGFKPYEFKTEK